MSQQESRPDDLGLSRTALAKGDLQHAIHHIGCALVADPTSSEMLEVLGEIVARSPDPLALVGLSQENSSFVTAASRAYIFARSGQLKEALPLLCEVVGVRPTAKYLQWAVWWLATPGAAESLPIDELRSGLLITILKLASSCPARLDQDDERRPNLECGLVLCRQICQMHPQESVAFVAAAAAARRVAAPEEALQYAQRASLLAPAWNTSIGVANVLRDMGRIDEALHHYAQSRTHDPDDLASYLDGGDALIDAQRYRDAMEQYGCVLKQEPEHEWALPSFHYARYRLNPSEEDRRLLLRLRAEGNERGEMLADEIDPPFAYVTSLPRAADSSTNAMRAVFERMFENPVEHHGSTVELKLTHIESPSVVAAFNLQMEMWGPHVGLNVSVEEIPTPDPRVPKVEVPFCLWVYDGVQPKPNIGPGDPNVAQMVFEIAEQDFLLEAWVEAAAEAARGLDPRAIDSLLAAMVNPPRPPSPDWRVLMWVQRVQIAAALLIAHIETGWEGSARKRTLESLLMGPVDWVVDAAVIALGALARKDASIRARVEDLFGWLVGQIPSSGYTCFEYPLISTWLSLEGHEPARKEWLEQYIARIFAGETGSSTTRSVEIKAKAFSQAEEMQKAQAAAEEAAQGGGGAPDPIVFPGQPLAQLSDYVGMMKQIQAGDMMGALGRYGLDMGSYAQIMQVWGQALQQDPALTAKFGQMMAQ
ncbi:MAG: hypothetical protein KUG77_17035 [Nannocystaceae bacterium]|nr:hypothetical protein [Nannocystaceae bacterium]